MKLTFDVTGMSCAACSARVEKTVNALDGVNHAEVNLLLGSMSVDFDPEALDEKGIIAAVTSAGYGAKVHTDGASRRDGFGRKETGEMLKRLVWSVILLIPLMYLSMGHMIGLPLPFFLSGEHNAVFAVSLQALITLPIVIINRKYFTVGFKSLFRGSPNMDSLIAVGSTASIVYGAYSLTRMWMLYFQNDHMAMHKYAMDVYFESAAMILALVTVGKYLETRSKGKTGEAIRSLMDLSPKTATVVRGEKRIEIPVEEIKKGDIVAVRAGGAFPADGIVVKGSGSADQSAITGESMPVSLSEGSRAVTATTLVSGYIELEVTAAGSESTLSKIIKLVEEASSSKAPIARLADKIAGIFVPVVMGIAAVTFVCWMIFGGNFEFALSCGIGVLVVSCPCALGLATPVAIMVGTGRGAKQGILIKSAEAIETAHKIDTVVMDKTGTITEGRPEVTDEVTDRESELYSVAMALEYSSEHPLAAAVVRYLGEKNIVPQTAEEFETVAGRGVRGTVGRKRCLAGNVAFMNENGINISPELSKRLDGLRRQGKTLLCFSADGEFIGALAVSDKIKDSSAVAVDEFRHMGITPVMLTGDSEAAAKTVASSAGIDRVIAEVLPGDKAGVIEKLKKEGHTVAMIGDGINDAPALTCADVGIAIGAGTDIAIESADMVLTRSVLTDAVAAVQLSFSVIRNIKMNLFWAFFYNTIGIPLAAGVLYPSLGIRLTPMFGAAAMSLSSVCVVLNALRLRRFKPKFHTERKSNHMTKKIITIEGMHCQHCAAAVKTALSGLEGVTCIKADPEQKFAEVEINGSITDDAIMAAVKSAGYNPVSVEEEQSAAQKETEAELFEN